MAMKILIDINHPAHVHYFRNFIKLMEAKGYVFHVINRDSSMINELLDYYGIEHVVRNKRPKRKGTIASLLNLAQMTWWCIRESMFFRPDIYLGFASSACAITSKLFRKPCILVDDTEHNSMNHKIYVPCCSCVLTPFYFNKQLGVEGEKQFRFNAFIEQFYLHSTYYHSETQVLEELGVRPGEYVIVRYIAYDAHHDLRVHPLSNEAKKRIIQELAANYRVFVSLESRAMDSFYDPYLLHISPEKMHDLEAHAKFMVTEGATMASEAFVLGVPYLYLNPLRCGYIDYQCRMYPQRSFHATEEDEAFDIIKRLGNNNCERGIFRSGIEKVTINPTEYLVQFVEKYTKTKR